MPLFEAVRLALAQIRVQKLKSFFTLIGVAIGVMFLIAIVSIVEGVGRYMEDDLVGKLITKNSFDVRTRPSIQMGDVDESEYRTWRNRPRITEDDVPVVVAGLPPSARWSIQADGNLMVESRYAKPRTLTINCVDGAWFDIKNMGVSEGRLPSAQEYEMGTPVVVIGDEARQHFFPGVSPIGREVRIGRMPYTVIGVAEKQGSAFGISLDKFAIVPYRTPAHRLVNRFKVIDGITVQSPTQQDMVSTMEVVRQTMRIQHKLRPGVPDDFSLQTQDAALAFWRKIQGYLVLAGVALPAIGLLVGSIVIMNIMLVAVAERTHEIGIRKALGAKRRDILSQFLAESTTLAVLGAAVGIAAGFGLAELIAAVSPLPAAVALWSIIVGVLVGAGVGIISGVYPATRAARLDPIAALRQET
ncbi:MAG TPA: ABC transporter permease [Gemmatimonadaceae bacterium]|nr:ABC transporter permease [Gemmatimonadaceae bacterium]